MAKDEQDEKKLQELNEVTVRFAGDSGDGMQLTGSQFSDTTALVGNDLSTLPDYPAEIRAPAGTLYGVSGFQLHFSSRDIHTPGDRPDILVAMNPAALKTNINEIKDHATIIVNTDAFDAKNLKMAGFETNPLEDGSLEGHTVHEIPITGLTTEALLETGLTNKEIVRSKNFFALGIMYWMFSRPLEPTLDWLSKKFAKRTDLAEANEKALKAGYYFGENTEIFTTRYKVDAASLPKGTYRNINGNAATALGMVAASKLANLPLYLGSYPITPASDILHELSKYKNYGVITFQAEDEIAGISSAIGASYGGHLALTTTSGPGLALKAEALGLAVMTELPLVVINVQRGGPSTGLPTKTEQADLLQAVYGRNGEAPIPVIAARTPSECFDMAIEASRIALKYMTPVILLTDGYIANGAEPWKLPDISSLPKLESKQITETQEDFHPYERDENYSRPWVKLGTAGMEHRIGGLEKANITGDVSYDPDNHDLMVRLRAKKIRNIENDIPELEVYGEQKGELLVVGWGGTYGALREAVEKAREDGFKVSHAHFSHIFPFPKNTRDVLNNFDQILCPEINLGQLSKLLKIYFTKNVIKFNKVRGLPFKSSDLKDKIVEIIGGSND